MSGRSRVGCRMCCGGCRRGVVGEKHERRCGHVARICEVGKFKPTVKNENESSYSESNDDLYIVFVSIRLDLKERKAYKEQTGK